MNQETNQDMVQEAFFDALVRGDRPEARRLVEAQRDRGHEILITDLFWPAYETLERLYRSDQLSALGYRLATRLLRSLVDQAAGDLPKRPHRGRRIFAVSGPAEGDELGAQMAVDLLEASGFSVSFVGGGIPGDEIMAHVHETRPDVLLMFASAPNDLPEIRRVIDSLREINACPETQIVVGGGVFNRADGLAEEIGADLWASDPLDLVHEIADNPGHRASAEQRTVGRNRRANAA